MADPLTVLVTGASSGIGRETAIELARRGHHVIAAARRHHALQQLEPLGIDVVPMDVTDHDSVVTASRRVDELTAGHGVDVLVNNAGHALFGPVETLTDTEIRRQFDINVFGLLDVTRAVLPAMRARGRGRIINISSMVGRVALPGAGGYSASKFALEALSDALRMELSSFGVSVVLVEPGFVATELLAASHRQTEPSADHAYADLANAYDKYFEQQLTQHTYPVELVGQQIADTAEIADPEARYLIPSELRQMVEFLRVLPANDSDHAILDAMSLPMGLPADGPKPVSR
jgi:NAD(P)-dependent dehydrogenase (short-subunit alcohol dehydrogenase family)